MRIFGKKEQDIKEVAKQQGREIKKNEREIEREKMALQREERQLVIEIKKAAKVFSANFDVENPRVPVIFHGRAGRARQDCKDFSKAARQSPRAAGEPNMHTCDIAHPTYVYRIE